MSFPLCPVPRRWACLSQSHFTTCPSCSFLPGYSSHLWSLCQRQIVFFSRVEYGVWQIAGCAVPGGFWERRWVSFLFKRGLLSKHMLPSMAFKDSVQKWWWGFSLGKGWSMKVKHWLAQRWTSQRKQDSLRKTLLVPARSRRGLRSSFQLEGYRIQFFDYLLSQRLLFKKKSNLPG